jgi:NADH:ubiquinone oxidoreductase subunit 5 (subunit L)/multisubunit Na+/H+ antiporter MnhA subunit
MQPLPAAPKVRSMFGASGFVRWSLSPLVLLFAILMPLLIEEWTTTRIVLMAGMELAAIALLAGFWLPARIGRWAFRTLAALIFLAYAGYLIHEFFFTDKQFKIVQNRGEASPRNALLGFIVIGVPSLIYALLGRFTLKAPEPEAEPEMDDDAHDKPEEDS